MPKRDVVIRADNEMMKQLCVNLLHNAAKFTPDAGNVRVVLEDETVSAKIIVEDDGGGIPEDQMEKIFEHFHQVDNSSTRKHGGSGLGLALCKNIAEWHDGKIWVENMHGGGARFIVILPKKQVVVRNQATGLSGAIRRFEMVAELLAVKRASIMLFDVSKSELKIESAIGIDEEIVESARVKVGDSISGRVVAEGRTYLVEDIEQDPRTYRCNNEYLYESKSFLSVPIKIEGEVVGVVNVANPLKKRTFDEEDQGLLEMFVERMGHALQKLEEFTHVSEDFEKIRETLKSIMDAKRFISLKNEMDIPALITRTADKLKLDHEEKATLHYALNIYDVGLVKIGYHIIKKPKELTPDERDKIKDHTILGIEMLKTIEAMPRVKDIVLYHHENFDGSGYPGRLSGKAIPIGARIIRVVDSFRALISNRPYQKPYSIDEAIEILKHRIGTFYDPDVVNAFVEAVAEERSRSESDPDSPSHTATDDIKQPKAGAAAPQLEEESNAQR
jgi:response regulator RpfG family c-di-GMP phosphodiesterase